VFGFEQIRKTINEGGTSLLLFCICRKLASPVLDFGSAIFFALDLGSIELRPHRKSQFLCRQVRTADARHLLDASDPIRTLEEVEERFRQGQICFAAISPAGRIVHTRWCAPAGANISELGRDIVPPPGEIYVYDSYTRPEFRGLGASSALLVFVLEALAEMGYSRLHAFVKADNIPVLRAVKPPHRKTGKLFYVRFRGFNPLVFGRRTGEFPHLAIPVRKRRLAEALHYGRLDK